MILSLAAAALLVPAVSFAQQEVPQRSGMRGGMGRMAQPNTIEWLLTQKEQFRPSAEQVAKLEELAAKLSKENTEQREKLQKLREEATNGGGGDADAIREQFRDAMQKMRKHDEEATEDAVKLLNDEQKKVVKDMLAARRKEMEERRRGMGRN